MADRRNLEYTELEELETNTDNIAKETGGNLASVKTNTDNIAKETGGNLASVKTNTDNLTAILTALQTIDNLFDDNSFVSGQASVSGKLIEEQGETKKIRIKFMFLNNADPSNTGEAKLRFGGDTGTIFCPCWTAGDGGGFPMNLIGANILSANNENVYLEMTTTTLVNYLIIYSVD